MASTPVASIFKSYPSKNRIVVKVAEGAIPRDGWLPKQEGGLCGWNEAGPRLLFGPAQLQVSYS